MTALDNIPENQNFLNPLNFVFQVKKLPHVKFFIQSINIPGISLSPTAQANPFVSIPKGGDHIAFDELQLSFKVDEDMENWKEIYNWIKGVGFPNRFDEYAELKNVPPLSGLGLISDISLLVLSSSRNPIFDIVFRDAQPITLSSLIFDTKLQDVNCLTATATFKYLSYSINDA